MFITNPRSSVRKSAKNHSDRLRCKNAMKTVILFKITLLSERSEVRILPGVYLFDYDSDRSNQDSI